MCVEVGVRVSQGRCGERGVVEDELRVTGRWQIMEKVADSLTLTCCETDIPPTKKNLSRGVA